MLPAQAIRNVALILPGAKDDHSWNQQNWDGLQALAAEDHLHISVQENVTPDKQLQVAKSFAQSNQLVFWAGGQYMSAAKQIAAQYPNTMWAVTGSNGASVTLPNMGSFDLKREQFAYALGYLAGLMTKTHKLGVLNAFPGLITSELTIIQLVAGAKAADPQNQVTVVYVKNPGDVVGAKAASEALVAKGVDALLGILNDAQQGVIQVAAEHHIWTIGRSLQQTELAPGSVLSNLFEDWNTMYQAIYTLAESGKMHAAVVRWGLDTAPVEGGSLQYSQGQEFNSAVPSAIAAKTDAVMKAIAAGQLKLVVNDAFANAGTH